MSARLGYLRMPFPSVFGVHPDVMLPSTYCNLGEQTGLSRAAWCCFTHALRNKFKNKLFQYNG